MSSEAARSCSFETFIAQSSHIPNQPVTVEELRERLALGTPFNEACNEYFRHTGMDGYTDLIGELYFDAMDNGTPAYGEGEQYASILVPNMVAAHQEYGHIGRTLEQYIPEAKGEHQRRIMLFCNWPKGADRHRVGQTLEIVTDFQKAHPEVPLSYCARDLSAGTAIGTILKMTVDTTLLGVRYSARCDDVMIVAHGADIVRLSPNHFDTMYNRFRVPSDLPMIAVKPRVLREQSGGKFPNLDSVMAWSDLHGERARSSLELGVGMSARGYMLADGPEPHRRLGELHDLLGRIAPQDQHHMRMPVLVKGAQLVTSARREWAHVTVGGSPRNFWDGDMAMTENYRDTEITSDISEEARDKAIMKIAVGNGPSLAAYEMARLINAGYPFEERCERVQRLISFASRLLGSGLHSEPWSGTINDLLASSKKRESEE